LFPQMRNNARSFVLAPVSEDAGPLSLPHHLLLQFMKVKRRDEQLQFVPPVLEHSVARWPGRT
jgi:hypothetical protein